MQNNFVNANLLCPQTRSFSDPSQPSQLGSRFIETRFIRIYQNILARYVTQLARQEFDPLHF